MLEERFVKKEATILCMEMSHFDNARGRYHLRSEKWWEDFQNGSSHDDRGRGREVNIEIHVIGISTCSIVIIKGVMNVEQKQRLT